MNNQSANKVTKLLIAAAAIAIIIFAVTFVGNITGKGSAVEVETTSSGDNSAIVSEVNIDIPDITGTHAIVYDQTTDRVLLNKNATDAYPIASITKLMTAIITLAELSPDQSVIITGTDLATEGSSNLILGEVWNNRDLVEFMLINSSNDAATALARTVEESVGTSFITLMERRSEQIGLSKDTKWQNPTGLDVVDGSVASNYASAADVVIMLDYFTNNYPDMAKSSTSSQEDFESSFATHTALTTNEISEQLPHLQAAKTGFTYVAGGNLAVITTVGPARPVYIVVLGSTYEERFDDVYNLYTYAQQLIQSHD